MSSRIRFSFNEPSSALSDGRTYIGVAAMKRIEQLWMVNISWTNAHVNAVPKDAPRWRRCVHMAQQLFGTPKCVRVWRQKRSDGFNPNKRADNKISPLPDSYNQLFGEPSPWKAVVNGRIPPRKSKIGLQEGAVAPQKTEKSKLPVGIWK